MTVSETGTSRSERMELRATKREKALLARAAALENMDVTSFVLRAALPEAQHVVDHHERIILDERDTDFILALLENPPPPAPELVQAFQDLQRHRLTSDGQ